MTFEEIDERYRHAVLEEDGAAWADDATGGPGGEPDAPGEGTDEDGGSR